VETRIENVTLGGYVVGNLQAANNAAQLRLDEPTWPFATTFQAQSGTGGSCSPMLAIPLPLTQFTVGKSSFRRKLVGVSCLTEVREVSPADIFGAPKRGEKRGREN